MNERIREIMVELKKTVSTERGAEVLIGYDEIEKFAELIIRECAELNFRELGLSGSASFDVGRMIKQQFGIEE